jgi:hypothetical protein
MARKEFEAFTQSLLKNYRRAAARAAPPLSRCLEVKAVEPGSLADRIMLAQGDLLVSMNGQSAALLSPKLWQSEATIREYIFYSPQTKERIELTSTGIDLGCELRRTADLIKTSYKPESRDPEPLLELWEAGAFPLLLELSSAALKKGPEDSPILPLYGAALYETGSVDKAVEVLRLYMREYFRGWTTEYRGIASFYLGLDKGRQGDPETAVQVLTLAYSDLNAERIARALVDLGQPRPTPAMVWSGREAPGDYELQTLEAERNTVTMSEALLALEEGQVFLLCLLSSYRGNGPWNDFMQRYLTLVRDFTPFIGPLHAITEVKERYPERPHYFAAEDQARAEGAPFELLFDPRGEVSAMYEPRVSPFVMALDHRGRILGEGQMEGPEVWRALVAANR